MSGDSSHSEEPSYSSIVARLDEHAIEHHTLTLADGSLLLVSQRGARIYGPFRGASAGSENWVPLAFTDAEAFSALIESGHWNIGGERMWIGPEIQYMIPDRADYWGSYLLPAAMDPGQHALESDAEGARLTSRFTLDGYNLGSGTVDLEMSISVRPAAHPLRFTQAYTDGLNAVAFAGYTERVALGQSAGPPLVSESWNLVQVRLGGQVIIPTIPGAEVTDYYEPSAGWVESLPGAVIARVTGDRRYKIGVKAPHTHGRVGYFRESAGGQASLLVRNFANDPSSVYAEEPDFAHGVRGDSIHIYNDDGGLWGFGELEARGRTIVGETGRAVSADEFTSWWFFGPVEQMELVSTQLLGASLRGAR